MRRSLGVATIICMLLTGVAVADRHHGGRGGGPTRVEDHRGGGGPPPRSTVVVRDHRPGPPARPARQGPSRVRVNGGRYVFPGGVVRVYRRPVIRRYYDVHVRPAVVVEQYDPVPGYVWVQGSWAWGGGEWVWSPGYWSAQAYVEAAPPPPPTATVQGGISVSGGISIH